MNQVAVVHVLNSLKGLEEELEGFDLAEPLILMQVVEQIPMLCILQHDINLLLLLKHIIELDDIFMPEPFVDKHLSPEVFPIHC